MRLFRKLFTTDADYIAFIKRCFQWTHEADLDALLFYNNYNFEIAQPKIDGIVRLVNDFKRTGTPIHGIGTQMHISIITPDDGIRTSLEQLAATGLLIHISELDVQITPNNKSNLIFTDQLLNAQREKFKTVA